MRILKALTMPIFLLLSSPLLAQNLDGSKPNVDSLPAVSQKYLQQVSRKSDRISKRLDRQTTKLLRQWKSQEARLRNKVAAVDSLKAKQLIASSKQELSDLQDRLNSTGKLEEYLPSLDSMSSSIRFLQQYPAFLSKAKGADDRLKATLEKTVGLDQQFAKSELVKKYIAERRQFLSDQLAKVGGPYTKLLKELNKRAYYYKARLAEYKSLLTDKKKAERQTLEYLRETKFFKDFMRRNSQLASLFRLPTDPNDPAALASLGGLQTRAQVNNLLQQQLSAGGPTAMAQVQQHIQEAQSKLNQLKDKLLKAGGSGSSDFNMPEGFKPNNQKTKSFLKRIEIGTNIQSQKASGYFPATSDLGISLGYKLNDRSIIGIGGSYKLGLGKDIRHMKVSQQGVGLRSFVDWKIKGSFWLTGGYELNYRSVIASIPQLMDKSSWQKSGLVGLSKVVSLRSKMLKQTKVQLLWDMLSYRQMPTGPPIVFRIGYNIK